MRLNWRRNGPGNDRNTGRNCRRGSGLGRFGDWRGRWRRSARSRIRRRRDRRWILLHAAGIGRSIVGTRVRIIRRRSLPCSGGVIPVIRLLRGRIDHRRYTNLRRIGGRVRNILRHRQLIFIASLAKIFVGCGRCRRGHGLRIQPGMSRALSARTQGHNARMPRSLRGHRDGESGQQHRRGNRALAQPESSPSRIFGRRFFHRGVADLFLRRAIDGRTKRRALGLRRNRISSSDSRGRVGCRSSRRCLLET